MAAFLRIWTICAAISIAPTLLLSFRALWAPFLCLALPAVVASLRGQFRPVGTLQRWALPAAVFLALVLFSCVWTPSGRAVTDALELFLAFGLTALMLRTPAQASWFLPLGVAWSLVILTIDAASGNTLRQWIPPDQPIGKDEVATARGLMLAFIMLPPALLYIHRDRTWRRRSPRAPLYVAGIAAAASGVLANGVAFFAGFAAYIIGSFRPQAMLRAVGAVWGLIFAAPFFMAAALPKVPQLLTLSGVPDSILHRLIIWRTVLDLWAEGRPVIGAGARATHTLTDRLGNVTLQSGADIPLVSAHPHNLPVQLLYEFGLIGYGLVIAFLVMGARALLAVPWRKEMAVAIAGLLSVLSVYISVEMDFWHLYTWCALSLSVWGLRAIAKDAG